MSVLHLKKMSFETDEEILWLLVEKSVTLSNSISHEMEYFAWMMVEAMMQLEINDSAKKI